MISGWSIGAMHAYEVTRQLLEQDEETLGLIILDMQVPQPMPNVLDTISELIDRADLVTGISRAAPPPNPAPKEMKEQLLSNVKALAKYTAAPIRTARRPRRTYVIWAKRGSEETWNDEPTAAGTDAVAEKRVPRQTVTGDPLTGLKTLSFANRSSFWPRWLGPVRG